MEPPDINIEELVTYEDQQTISQVVEVIMGNEAAESAYRDAKNAGKLDNFTMTTEPYEHFMKYRLKEPGQKLFPTERKIFGLSAKGCSYYSCPSMLYARNRNKVVNFKDLNLSEVTTENLADVSNYCLDKYRKGIEERDNPTMVSPYKNVGYLQWRKLKDGRMGCVEGNEHWRTFALYPISREEEPKRGVTDVPPLALFDNNEFELTKAYCKNRKMYHQESTDGKHNDDCYRSVAQIIGETIFGVLYREFWTEW